MKRIAQALGVSRSNLIERAHGRSPARGPYKKAGDDELLPRVRRFVDERPTYGYRRIAALVNRELAEEGLPHDRLRPKSYDGQSSSANQ
jgi:transposase InsO family protein